MSLFGRKSIFELIACTLCWSDTEWSAIQKSAAADMTCNYSQHVLWLQNAIGVDENEEMLHQSLEIDVSFRGEFYTVFVVVVVAVVVVVVVVVITVVAVAIPATPAAVATIIATGRI